MNDFDIKTAPIQFARQADGTYLSACGTFQIRKGTTARGGDDASRWWVTARGRGLHHLTHPHWGLVHSYTHTLKRAIECVNYMIARNLCAAFQVFSDRRREIERAEAEAAALQASIDNATRVIETNIQAWLAHHGTARLSQVDGVRALARHLASPGGAL